MAPIYRSNLIGIKESVVDEFLLLNHYQIPLLSIIGFSPEVSNTTHQWNEDEMFAKSDPANNGAAILAGDGSFTVTDGTKFRIGHVISAAGSDELMLITNVVGNVLTVTRAYAGTVAAGFADGTTINVEFIRGVEGAAARTARYKARTNVYNYTQIFDDTIDISGTAEAVAQWGVANEYEKEKAKKLQELGWQLENALINGRLYSSGTDTKMKGIRSFIATNVTNGGGVDVTEDMINSMVQDVWETGGMNGGGAFRFMMGPTQKRMMSKLFSSDIIIPHMDTIRGLTVETLRTDFGTFPIVVNDHLRDTEIFFIDTNRIYCRPLKGRNWFHTYMGKVGDSTMGTIVGEFTMEFRQEKAHSRLYNLDTS